MEPFSYKNLVVVYEDNHVLVVYKPQNVPSQPDSSNDPDMLSVVKDYVKVKYNKAGEAFVGLVHRLDRPTGGVMVFAKTSKAASRLSESIANGDMQKKYLCVTCQLPQKTSGKLVDYLVKDEQLNKVKVVPMGIPGAKRAELDYELIEARSTFGLFKIDLHTGRSHQIRVQMANIGCPLYGDQKYGADPKTFGKNLALWAYELSFTHPTLKERMKFLVYPNVEEAPWKAYQVARWLNINMQSTSYKGILEDVLMGFDKE